MPTVTAAVDRLPMRYRESVLLSALNLAVSAALAGVLWVVQLVVYPSFSSIDQERFQSFHRGYTTAITFIVAPLILGQAALCAALLHLRGASTLLMIEAALAAFAAAVTFFVSVPIHDALQREATEQAMRRLVATNWLRTAAWSGAAVAALAIAA